MGMWSGENCIIIYNFNVFDWSTRVTDRQTDGRYSALSMLWHTKSNVRRVIRGFWTLKHMVPPLSTAVYTVAVTWCHIYTICFINILFTSQGRIYTTYERKLSCLISSGRVGTVNRVSDGFCVVGVERLNDIILRGHTSELRDITCHGISHSVTCHPTQVNAPCLTPDWH